MYTVFVLFAHSVAERITTIILIIIATTTTAPSNLYTKIWLYTKMAYPRTQPGLLLVCRFRLHTVDTWQRENASSVSLLAGGYAFICLHLSMQPEAS